MDADLKAKWVAALRSGQYQQGRGYLQKQEALCCLGVLLDLQSYPIKENLPNLDSRMTSVLPKDFACGLSVDDTTALANRNDGSLNYHAHSFEEIANYIEKNL